MDNTTGKTPVNDPASAIFNPLTRHFERLNPFRHFQWPLEKALGSPTFRRGLYRSGYTGWRNCADHSSAFPQSAITGSLGELARTLSRDTEVSEELLYASALTVFGSLCEPRLRLRIGVRTSTCLYTVLLGKSAEAKKSSAMRRVTEFFQPLFSQYGQTILPGIGSAEGLLKTLSKEPKVLLQFDEFRALLDKAGVQNSVLLPMLASLYEQENWSNATKEQTISVENAHISMIGCCTTDTYAQIWTSQAIAIGFPNRLFLVDVDAKPRVAWPAQPDPFKLTAITKQISAQLNRLPLTLDIESGGRERWKQWYQQVPHSQHANRLDTLGFRLMPIVALITDKEIIDLETVEQVIAILDYEFRVRVLYDPVDADTAVAKLEEKIRRKLTAKGSLTRRELQQATHANRDGLWAFDQALNNLKHNLELIVGKDSRFRLTANTENRAA